MIYLTVVVFISIVISTIVTVPLQNEYPADSPIRYAVPCGFRQGYEYNRIVGGSRAEPGEFPWLVSIQAAIEPSPKHFCGGAIISDLWVITAAHCTVIVPRQYLLVVAGEHKLYEPEGTEQTRTVEHIISNGFILNTFTHDIALLRLNASFQLDGRMVAPICLPNNYAQFTGSATIAGWGKLAEDGGSSIALQQITIPLIPQSVCYGHYNTSEYHKYLNGCQVCAGTPKGGVDACQGDSGGPLMCRGNRDRYYLCGIVSWGVGCGRENFPGVNTEVSCYSDWVARIIYNINGIRDGYPRI